MASANVNAQNANRIETLETKPETSAKTIDTLLVNSYFSEKKTSPTINKNALIRGYRKTLRRQKDLYLIPWELRKKHLRVC